MRTVAVPKAVLVAIVVLSLALTGCQGIGGFFGWLRGGASSTSVDDYLAEVRSSATPTVSPQATKREGVLTVGLKEAQTSPFVIEEGGEVEGLDVSIACALADQLGLSVEFTKVADTRTALATVCDMVMGVTPSEANGFAVIGNYSQLATGLFQHGSDAPPATAEQVRGSNVAVQDGSSALIALQQTGADVKAIPCSSLTEAFGKLAGGEASFVACSLPTGMYMCGKLGGASLAGTIDAPVPVGLAIPAEENELHNALVAAYGSIESNGLLSEARRIWLGSNSSIDASAQIQGIAAPPAPQPEAPAPEAPVPEQVNEPPTEIVAGSNAVTLSGGSD